MLFLNLGGGHRAKCPINLHIRRIQADVVQPFNMTLKIHRAGDRLESEQFEVSPANRETEIDVQF